MVPAVPRKSLATLDRIARIHGDEPAYYARFAIARAATAGPPSAHEAEFRRRMAENERLLIGRTTCLDG